MTDLHKAAQQALEAMFALRALIRDDALACSYQTLGQYRAALLQTIDRAAMAQQAEPKGGGNLPPPLQAEPVQEPVAWMCSSPELMAKGYTRFSSRCEGDWNIPVYTAPPQRKPLTEEEVEQCFRAAGITIKGHRWTNAVRNVERAHGIGEQP